MHPAIKLGNDRAAQHIDGWIQTMRNLAANGLEVICYNFMPVVDWTRTDLRWKARRGGLALRFDPCLLYTSPSPRDGLLSRMPSSA